MKFVCSIIFSSKSLNSILWKDFESYVSEEDLKEQAKRKLETLRKENLDWTFDDRYKVYSVEPFDSKKFIEEYHASNK